jgi:hypothetical protein
VPFAPRSFDAVYDLQFASGNRSTYYHLGPETPVTFKVHGPTTLTIYTRLDFDQTMNGSQTYSLEVSCDGEVWRCFHYHTEKLTSARYVQRDDILPGARKVMSVPVPKGTHEYVLRCVRPSRCGVAVQIRLPKADLGGKGS